MSISGIVSVSLIPFVFGTAYVPVRMFDSGDGIFVQFMMCLGLLLPGFICQLASGSTAIFYYAMLGGGLYAIANIISLCIMEGLGMMLGSLLWNTSICLVSWGFARFGVIGEPELANNNFLNITAIIVLILGGVLFAMVKNSPTKPIPHPHLTPKSIRLADIPSNLTKEEEALCETHETPIHVKRFPSKNFCMFLCAVVGLFYGNMLTPVKLMTEAGKSDAKYVNASSDVLYVTEPQVPTYPTDAKAYLFSFALGAVFTSTTLFVIYALAKKNMPVLNPNVAAPALLSGAIYGTGVSLLAIANAEVSQIVAFPIAAMSPGLINGLWAILLFKEIKGRRNFVLLAAAFVVSLFGILLLGLSKL